ncbi:hypothetical protein SHANETTE_25 [Bacillus phage Shanette]|uniref:Uncharacterized protein n=1 Tax=Bacillus phage Shanette TaxID=1296656 RepID=S5M9D5_9CAUD|nr:hypothetical protein AVV46_gp025 [Bacillus phage Shanette]AGR47143.1 hypothetical protein SHANETTE_25 [Bacillus phage Shanette]
MFIFLPLFLFVPSTPTNINCTHFDTVCFLSVSSMVSFSSYVV